MSVCGSEAFLHITVEVTYLNTFRLEGVQMTEMFR